LSRHDLAPLSPGQLTTRSSFARRGIHVANTIVMLRLPPLIAAVILVPACNAKRAQPQQQADAAHSIDADNLDADRMDGPTCRVECYTDGSGSGIGSESYCGCSPDQTTCPDGCHECDLYCFPNAATPDALCPTCVTLGDSCGSDCYGLG
jgi:hypothetical protein